MSEANLLVNIVLQDGARAGFDALGLSSMSLGRSMFGLMGVWNQLSPTMKGTAVATGMLGLAFGALADIQHQAIDAAGNLDQEMARLSISINGLDGHMGEMRDTLVNLADSSIYSTAQIADGFTSLGVDGFNATQIMNGMGDAAKNMSEAMNTQTTPGFNLLGTAMEMYGADASQATQFANDLTFAFFNGQKTVANLQQSINMVGPTASQLKVPFGELADVLALLGQAGLKGSQGASSLNYYLTNLASPTTKAAKELANLGIMVVDTTAPAFKQLEAALGNSGKAGEKAMAAFDGTYTSLNEMFTTAVKAGNLHTDQTLMEWAAGGNVLKNSLWDANGNFVGLTKSIELLGPALDKLNPEQRAIAISNLFNVRSGRDAREFYANFIETINKIGDLDKIRQQTSAAKDASKAIDNWNSAIKQLGSTWTDSLARIGGSDLGVLRGVVGVIQNLLHTFNTAPDSVHSAAAAILAISTTVSGLGFVVGTAAVAWAVFGATLSPLLPIVGSILGIVAGVALGVMLLVKSLHDAQSAASPLHPIFVLLGNMMGQIGNQLHQLGAALNSMGINWNNILAILKVVAAVVGGVLIGALVLVVGAILGVVFVLTKLWQFQALVLHGIIALATGAIEWFGSLQKSVTEKITLVQAVIHNAFTFIGGLFVWLYNHNYYVKALVDTIIVAFQQARQFIYAVVTTIENTVFGTWNRIVGTARAMWTAFTVLIHSFLTPVKSAANGIVSGIMGAVDALGSLLWNSASHAIDMFIGGIRAKIGAVVNAAKEVAGLIGRVLGFHSPPKEGPLADSDQYMPNMMKMYAGGIDSHAHLVHASMSRVALGMQPGVNLPSSSFVTGAHTSSSGNGDTHIHVEVGGKEVATLVLDGVTRQLKNNGRGRVMQ